MGSTWPGAGTPLLQGKGGEARVFAWLLAGSHLFEASSSVICFLFEAKLASFRDTRLGGRGM